MADRKRDLALFNLAIDSKLRGCDVVAIRVEDIAPHGYAIERATVRQKKTGRPVRFELTEQTRQAVDEYLRIDKQEARTVPFRRATSARASPSRPDNMPVSSLTGYAASGSIRACSVRIHCGGPRRR